MDLYFPRAQQGSLALATLISGLFHLALITILFGSGRGGFPGGGQGSGRGGASGHSPQPGPIMVARLWEGNDSPSVSLTRSPNLPRQSEAEIPPPLPEQAVSRQPEAGSPGGQGAGTGQGSGQGPGEGGDNLLGGLGEPDSGRWGLGWSPEEEPGVEPSCAACPKPKYSALAKSRGLEGAVWLQIEVLPDGNPGDVFVSQSSGFSELDQLALRTVKQEWKFFPGRRGGRLVTRRAEVKIKFRLDEAD